MAQFITGTAPLSYQGVQASTPPQMIIKRDRAPVVSDINFPIGTFWLYCNLNTSPTLAQELYQLVRVAGPNATGIATWIQLYPALGSTDVFTADVGGSVTFANTNVNLNVIGGSANVITTANDITKTISIDLATNLVLTGNIRIDGNLTIPNIGGGAPNNAGVLFSDGAGVLSSVAGTDGQVIIGAAAPGVPIWANLIAGANVGIVNGPNTITISSAGGGGGGNLTFDCNGTNATSVGATINTYGTANQITVIGDAAQTVTFGFPTDIIVTNTITAGTDLISTAGNVNVLAGNVNIPDSNAAGTIGFLQLGGFPYLHNLGQHNTFIGEQAGNLALDPINATDNNCLGFTSLAALNIGAGNSAFGDVSLNLLTDGSFNMAFGSEALANLLTGSNNIAVGYQAGTAYVGAESSNILFSNAGVVGESNTMRLSSTGVGVGQVSTAYIGGIFNSAQVIGPGITHQPVFVDSNDLVYTRPSTVDGEIFIGDSTTGEFILTTLTAGIGIGIVNTPGSILINNTGGGGAGGITKIHSAAGDATLDPADDSVTIIGFPPVTTSAINHTLTVKLENSAIPAANQAYMILGRSDTHAATWGLLTSTGASVNITQPTPTSINLEVVGAGGGASTFTTDGANAIQAAGTLSIIGGLNMVTSGATNVVTVATKTSLTAGVNGFTNSLADGTFQIGGDRFMHCYKDWTNTFVGRNAGNYTLTVASATNNTGIGNESLLKLTTGRANTALGTTAGYSITTGENNVCIGLASGVNITTGLNNVAIGYQALDGVTTGSNNIAIGTGAGGALVTGNSNSIIIGTDGTVGDQNMIRLGQVTSVPGHTAQNKCFVAGINGITTGNPCTPVYIDALGKLGTVPGAGAPTNGQVLIAATGAVPLWRNITTPNGTVVISNGPNSIGIDVGSNVAFLYVLQADTPYTLTGDGTLFTLGTAPHPLTKIFDKGVNFVGTTFTAPVTGKYYLEMQILATNLNWAPPIPPPPAPNPVDPLNIVTTQRLYSLINTQFTATEFSQSVQYSVFADMTVGDTATFQVGVVSQFAGKYVGLGMSQTFISGFYVTS
jgi:hypothetical protein